MPRCRQTSRPRAAHTLVELCVACAIVAILLLVALPRLGTLADRYATESASADVLAAFDAARQLAMHRSTHAAVLLDTAAATLLVRAGADTAMQRDLHARHGITLSATRDSMSFAPDGLGYGAANLSVISRRGSAAETVFVSRLGRARR